MARRSTLPRHVGPITIRGVTYRTVKEAAHKLDITPSAIYNARIGGWLEQVGLGRAVMPIKIRGITYRSAKEAAKALGVHKNRVYHALNDGTLDTVGVGTGCHNSPKNGSSKPLDLGRVRFSSVAEAARYIGKPRYYVANKLASKYQRPKVIAELLAEWEKRNGGSTQRVLHRPQSAA